VAANLLFWPGLGTALAKRRIGLVQMGISGAGFVMVVIGMIGLLARWLQTINMPGWRDQYVLTAFGGLALFVLTWCWAVFSSISIVRAAKQTDTKLPPRID